MICIIVSAACVVMCACCKYMVSICDMSLTPVEVHQGRRAASGVSLMCSETEYYRVTRRTHRAIW